MKAHLFGLNATAVLAGVLMFSTFSVMQMPSALAQAKPGSQAPPSHSSSCGMGQTRSAGGECMSITQSATCSCDNDPKVVEKMCRQELLKMSHREARQCRKRARIYLGTHH